MILLDRFAQPNHDGVQCRQRLRAIGESAGWDFRALSVSASGKGEQEPAVGLGDIADADVVSTEGPEQFLQPIRVRVEDLSAYRIPSANCSP